MDKKEEKALKRVQAEIKKIDKKENNVFFFILDTKGNPSGSLEYIYKLAMIAKNDGYKVGMLYQSADKNDKFVGVRAGSLRIMLIFPIMISQLMTLKSHLLTSFSF